MRVVVAGFCWVLAVLLSLLLVPSAWAERQITDRDAFQEFAGPLADDEAFVEALGSALAETTVEAFEMRPEVAERVEPLIADATVDFASQEGFPEAWRETLDRTHEAMFPDDGAAKAVLDVTPMARLVLAGVLPERVVELEPDDARLIIDLGNDDADRWLQRSRSSGAVVWTLGIAVAGLALIVVAASRNRGLGLSWVGGGAVVSAGLLALLFGVIGPGVVRGLQAERPAARELMAVTAEAAGDSLATWLWTMAGVGLAVVVLGAITSIVFRSSSSR